MAGEKDEPRRLRADGTAGTSLADRLGQLANKLSWRTPVHRMRLRGRYPLQLVDVPADPIPGRIAAGKALREGRMLHAGESIALDALHRGGWRPAFGDYYQSFAWLRDLALAGPRGACAPIAQGLMRPWLNQHGHVPDQAAWRADLWGWRILFWTAYAPYILDTRDADYRKDVLNALARGARHLDRAADSAAQGLPRVAAWAGVIAAGLLIPGGDLRTAHGEAGIARALAQAMHTDGGLASRSPAEQLRLVELLSQLRAVYEVRARPPGGAIARALSQAVPALLAVTLGDDGLSSWQSGGPVVGTRVEAAVAASGVRARALEEPRDWGYQRLAQSEARLVMDAGPPPVAALAKGGCASTLAFEFSDGRQRLIVNCGGAPGLPDELASALRSTAAHSTLILADANSTAILDDGALGRGVTEVELTRSETNAGSRAEGGHDGYVRRFGFSHRRRLLLATDGRSLEGEDRLVPTGRRKADAATPLAIRFHVAPDVEIVETADGHGALLRPGEAPAWQFRATGGIVTVEDSLWVDFAGRPRATRQLVVSAESPAEGIAIPWSFKRVK